MEKEGLMISDVGQMPEYQLSNIQNVAIKSKKNDFDEDQDGQILESGRCPTVLDITVTSEALALLSRGDTFKAPKSGQRMMHCTWTEGNNEIPRMATRWKVECQNVITGFYTDVLKGLYEDQFARARKLLQVLYEMFGVQLVDIFGGNLGLEFECVHPDQESVEKMDGEQGKVKQVFQQLISDCTHVGEDIPLTVTCIRTTSSKHGSSKGFLHDVQAGSQSGEQIPCDFTVDKKSERTLNQTRLTHVETELQKQKTVSLAMMEMLSKLQKSMNILLRRDATSSALPATEKTKAAVGSNSMDRSDSNFQQYRQDISEKRREPLVDRFWLGEGEKPPMEMYPEPPESNIDLPHEKARDKPLKVYNEPRGDSEVLKPPLKIPEPTCQANFKQEIFHHQGKSLRAEPANTMAFVSKGGTVAGVSKDNDAERLLESLHVACNSRLLKSIELALRPEDSPSPRAKTLDTILCLDISDSIKEKGLAQMKRIANKFIDGVEEVAEQYGLEENLAVVTFGGPAKVAQHLTNDYSRVRDVIDDLKLEGRSPMFEALIVCEAATQGRGGVLNIAGLHKIRPRIIFITDGKLTDEEQETGPDEELARSSTIKVPFVRLVTEFSSPKQKTTPKPIAWIPVGDADEIFLTSLAKLGNGMLVREDDVDKLIRYFRKQESIGKVYAVLKKHKDDYPDLNVAMEAIVSALVADVHPEDKKEIIEMVQDKLQHKETGGEPDDYHNVTEEKELPPLGSRVVRGPDWKWENQDTDGSGTIINHDEDDKWIWVMWDNGNYNAYRFGKKGAYDIVVVDDQPRFLTPSELIEIGVSVTRGPDWKYSNQDGGPGNVGVVIRKREDGKVKVRWSNGHINSYRYGMDGKFDLAVRDPLEQMKQYTSPTENVESSPILPPARQTDIGPRTKIVWQWKDDRGQWRLYPDDQLAKLEREYTKRPNRSCVVQRNGNSYCVRFEAWQEVHLEDKTTRDVQRQAVDDVEYDSLRAIELSLQ